MIGCILIQSIDLMSSERILLIKKFLMAKVDLLKKIKI